MGYLRFILASFAKHLSLQRIYPTHVFAYSMENWAVRKINYAHVITKNLGSVIGDVKLSEKGLDHKSSIMAIDKGKC
jgi:hypothetical protein